VHGAVFAPHAIFCFVQRNTWLREFIYWLKPLDFFRHANVKSHIPKLNKDRILNFLNDGSYTVTETQNKLNLSYSNTKKHLRELYNMNKIQKIKGSGPIPNKWFIENQQH